MTIEERLDAIEQRNQEKERDKAWETSHIRKLTIVVFTYLVAAVYMAFLGVDGFYLHALVPTGGYYLSTLTLPFVRKLWESRR